MTIAQQFKTEHATNLKMLQPLQTFDTWNVISVKAVKPGCYIEIFEYRDKFFVRVWDSLKTKRPFTTVFRCAGERMKFIKRYIETCQQDLADKRKEENHGVKVGDVFRCSWGYDQTNIDFYQVVKLAGKKSVHLRPIKSMVKHKDNMRGTCIPDVDNFDGEAFRKQITVYRGDVHIKIASYAMATLLQPKVINGAKIFNTEQWTAYA